MRSPTSGAAGSFRFTLLAGAAAAAFAIPSAAFAQDLDEDAELDAPDEGNQIVVTATKRELTLQETPVAVSVTTGETIERAQIRDIADLQSVVPSLRVSQLQSSFATSFSVRGFGTDGNNLGLEPSVAVFVDGVFRSRTIAQISDLPNLQRVEVLRGPQSTLFGKNASAGVISIVSSEPSFDFSGNLEASYGNLDAFVLKGYVTGPVSDTVAVSVAGGYNRRDGFITNGFNGDDLNNRDRWFVRSQLLFDNGTNLKVRVIADYDEINEECCAVVNLQPSAETGAINLLGGQVNSFEDRFDVAFSDVDPFNEVQNWGLSGQIDYEFGDLTLTSITAYRETSIDADQDVDFTSAAIASGANIGQADINTFTQELRLASNFDGPLNFLAGAYYINEDIEVGDQIVFGPDFRPFADLLIQGGTEGALNLAAVEALLPNPFGPFFAEGTGFNNLFIQENEAFSIFGQFDFEVTDRLTLTLGANYTRDTKDVFSFGESTEAFSNIDLDDPLFAPSRNALLLAGGLAAAGVNPNDPAAVLAFATDPATAPIFAGIQAFADANENNPDANPLGPLRDFQFLPPIVNIPNAVEDGQTTDDDVTYIVRASYELSDSINAYVSYATGFKASSFNLSRDSRPLAADLPAILAQGLGTTNLTPGTRFALPEESEVWELGLKGDWGNAGANLTFFLQTINDFQANTFIGASFVLSNAGEQETFGIEFDGYFEATNELTFNVAATYLDAQFESFVGSPVGDLSGEDVAGIHPFSLSLGATWNKEFDNGNALILRTDYQYEADVQILNGLTNFIGTNADGTPDFAPALAIAEDFRREINNVNASATYVLENGLEFSIWGRNIFDDRFITTIFPSVAQGQSISGYPNQPRTYGGTVRFKF